MAYTTIDDPSAYFQTTTYTGDGNDDRQVTNSGNSDLQPDWIWVKNRSDAFNHILQDTSRGLTTGGYLASNQTQAESGATTVLIKTATSNGFTVGTSGAVNANTDNLVAWQWKANAGSTSSNTDGSITSTVQANTTAGFSIVTWTGTGSAGTIAHGLGTTPSIIISKNRDESQSWIIGSNQLTNYEHVIKWNDSGAAQTSSNKFNSTAPTSTVFSVGTGVATNGSSDKVVAYCFSDVKGYSKIGSYTGNGSTDGPFVYTGFKPAWLMIKRTDSTGNWFMFDNKREGYNPDNDRLIADTNLTEADPGESDLLSNGFKMRFTSGNVNASGGTYIYMAFAEHPFVSSKGVPVTAR